MFPAVISIDPPGAREIDDAIACRRLPDGGWIVDVCIPDVPSVVQPGCENDGAARQAGLTTYGANGVRQSMLPPEIVEAVSLSPDSDRPMIHVRMKLAPDLETSEVELRRILHRTCARLTYEQADAILDAERHELKESLSDLWSLARLLHEDRAASTGAVFDIRSRLYTNEEGQKVRLDDRSAHRSNMIVMEIMVLANAALAGLSADRALPILYRNHHLVGFERGDRDSAALQIARDQGIGRRAARKRLRTMSHLVGQAELGTMPLGHHGLDLQAYAWFTSPLRRYADIVNLRALLEEQDEQDLPALASRLTQIHREQKDLSSGHHGRSSRRRIVELIDDADEKALLEWDVHTIVRALTENPAFDRANAMRHIARRMAADDLSGKDMETLLCHAETLFGPDAHETVTSWVGRDGPRAIILDAHLRGEERPTKTDEASINHKGALLERAASAKARVSFSEPRRTGPSHVPIFTVTASWTRNGQKTEAEGSARTVRGAEHAASSALTSLLIAAAPVSAEPVAPAPSPKSALLELAQRTPHGEVRYAPAVSSGPAHSPSFSVELHVRIGRHDFRVTGKGSSKKEAERHGSEVALVAIAEGAG